MSARLVCVAAVVLGMSAGLSCDRNPGPTRTIEPRIRASGLPGEFIDCSPSEVTKLTQGLALMRQAFQSPRMIELLKQYQMDGPRHGFADPENGSAYPEWIVARMTEDLPTNITCYDGVNDGEAQMCLGDERIRINHEGSLANADPEDPPSMYRLAGLLTHEVSHNKCLGHFYGTASTVQGSPTLSVEDAVTWLLTDPEGRFALLEMGRLLSKQETTLAPVGLDYETATTGPQWDDSLCRGTRVAAGFQVGSQAGDPKPGVGPDSLALLCEPQEGGCWDSVSSERGFPGSRHITAACECNEVMVGAYGHSGVQLRSVGALCAKRDEVLAGTVASVSRTTEHGSVDGLEWTRQCPTGMVVKGFRIRTDEVDGSYPISHLDITCQTLQTSEAISLSSMDGLGARTRTPYVERCLGREVVTALAINHTSTSILAVGGGCTPVVGSNSSTTLAPTAGVLGTYGIIPSVGSDLQGATTNSQDACPNGFALVGFRGAYDLSNEQVQGLQGICANFETWPNLQVPQNLTLSYLSTRGGNSGDWKESLCARGSYLNGWTISDRNGVTLLKGICRSFSATADQGGPSFLTFEDPVRPWTSNALGLFNSTVEATHGQGSLKVVGCNYMIIDSPLFATYELPVVGTRLAFDIKLPTEQSNPYWLGQAQMFISIPTAQIFNKPLGNVELTQLAPLGVWKTAEFDLPSDVREALLLDRWNDNSMTITLNTPNCPTGIYIDHVRFTGQLTPRSPRLP